MTLNQQNNSFWINKWGWISLNKNVFADIEVSKKGRKIKKKKTQYN